MSSQDNSIFKNSRLELNGTKNNASTSEQNLYYVSGIKIVKHDDLTVKKFF